MKILILSPLYPPDIAPLAVYVKEVATRLSHDHEVTIVAYTQIPELINGVRIIPVSKNNQLLFRVLTFMYDAWKEIRNTDVVYVQNGASAELPTALLSLITRKSIVLRLGDPVALTSTKTRSTLKYILNFIMKRAEKILCDVECDIAEKFKKKSVTLSTPAARPEILPFSAYPEKEMGAYEKSWDVHVSELITIFKHVTD